MNAKRLTQQTVICTAAIAACALVLPAVASLKNPVTRPLRNSGSLILTVDPNTGVYQFSDWGQATHAGRYSDTASGEMNLATSQFISGYGTIVAANGDTIDWKIGAPNEIVYTGGTGRFQGVTGGFPAVITSVTPLDITGDTWTFGLTYTGNGEITY